MNTKDFYHFEDFILDDSFRKYIEKTDSHSIEFWEEWLRNHPEVKDEFTKASDVLQTLISNKKIQVNSSKAALKTLLRSIERENKSAVRKIYLTIARAAAILIIATGLVWLGYSISNNNKAEVTTTAFNEIIVPVGEKSQIVLSDGTHVWINSASRFKYPVDFGQNSREVSLEGEAYFDVTRKGTKEFVVNTADATIHVLGTSFNVKAYPGDKKTQTTVVQGLVRVESRISGIQPVLIRPDEMAVTNAVESDRNTKDSRLKVIEKVNTPAITSWKDQMLVFADETFADIAVKMERWFNTRIIIEDENIKMERYTGKFVHNETVYEVLKAIQLTTPIEYTVKDNVVIIKKK